jgi:hypothetical protein
MEPAPSLTHRGRAMDDHNAFVGLDVHKESIAVAVAETGRGGEVRFLGEIRNEAAAVIKSARKIGRSYPSVLCAYEAGGADTGFIVNSLGLAMIVWWRHRLSMHWTDYLPIILPTEKRVAAMLAGTTHKPDEVVGAMRPANFPMLCCDNEEEVIPRLFEILKGCIGWEISRIGDLDDRAAAGRSAESWVSGCKRTRDTRAGQVAPLRRDWVTG